MSYVVGALANVAERWDGQRNGLDVLCGLLGEAHGVGSGFGEEWKMQQALPRAFRRCGAGGRCLLLKEMLARRNIGAALCLGKRKFPVRSHVTSTRRWDWTARDNTPGSSSPGTPHGRALSTWPWSRYFIGRCGIGAQSVVKSSEFSAWCWWCALVRDVVV